MDYTNLIENILEDLLLERIHLVTSKRFPGFAPEEREIFRGPELQDPDVEQAGDRVSYSIAKGYGDQSPSSLLYRPSTLPSDSPIIRGLQGTDRVATEPGHVKYRMTPGHRDPGAMGVDIAGPALYTSPHAAAHEGGRSVFAMHAGPGGRRLTLGRREDPEFSTAISHNIGRLALDALVTPRDRTVEKRHSRLDQFAKFKEGKHGLEFGGNAKELDDYVKNFTDPDALKDLSTVDADWKMGEAGMKLARHFRTQGIGSVAYFPTSLGGKSSKIVFPHQERLRSYWGGHSPSSINAETDWSKLTK